MNKFQLTIFAHALFLAGFALFIIAPIYKSPLIIISSITNLVGALVCDLEKDRMGDKNDRQT